MSDEMVAPQAPYRFSNEELKVLRQCNSESFYQRCLPFSTALGIGTYYGVKSGFLQPSNRYGAVPKVVAAVICGFVAGKISYQGKCAEKLMALPDSKLGAALRSRKRRGTFQEMMTMDAPEIGKVFSDMPETETFSDVPQTQSSYMDLDDSSRPLSSDGIDDMYRPTLDMAPLDEDAGPLPPPVPQRTTTYEELRKKNREEHELKRTKAYRGVLAQDEVPATIKPKESDQPDRDMWRKSTNKYGDSWEK